MRDGRARGDAHQAPEGGCQRQALATLRFSEVAEGLGAVFLPEGGSADDELPRPAKGDDFGVLASLSSEQFLELVQQVALEFEPRRAGREVSLAQLRAVAGVFVLDCHG